MQKHTSNINLEGLNNLCKGNETKKHKYLKQFLKMIPLSIQKLKFATEEGDRTTILKEFHFISPQLLFFGIDDMSLLMEKERENEGLSFDALKNQIDKIIIKIEKALKEVESIIENKSNNTLR